MKPFKSVWNLLVGKSGLWINATARSEARNARILKEMNLLRHENIKNQLYNEEIQNSYNKQLDKIQKQNDKFKGGSLVTTENEFKNLLKGYDFYKNNIKLIPGFYKDSLDEKLVKKFKKNKVKASLINFDCDLTQSVDETLKFSLNFSLAFSLTFSLTFRI